MTGSTTHVFWRSPDPEASLVSALDRVAATLEELPSQTRDAATASIGGVRDIYTSWFAPESEGWSSIHFHLGAQLGSPFASVLSAMTHTPAVLFCEYDQDAWGFQVFEDGRELATFWNFPESVGEDPADCSVEPAAIASLFGVPVETVAPYLHHLAQEDDEDRKAFPEDEFSLTDHWVRVDFMRRLGMTYPDDARAGTRRVMIHESGSGGR